MKTNATKAPKGAAPALPADLIEKLAREDRFVVEHFAEYGVTYYNPLLGLDESETFGNIEHVMQMLHAVLDPEKDVDLCEAIHGLRLVVQTVWSAAQYESARLNRAEGGAA